MIKQIIKKIYRSLIIEFLSKQSILQNSHWTTEDNSEFKQFRACIDKSITYELTLRPIDPSNAAHKWVGAQVYHDKVYAMPNDETRVLCYDVEHNRIDYITGIKTGLFKWTGGCVWKNAIYCFPRTANSFLRIDEKGTKEIPLTFEYKKEHHYSGVCTKDGIVYQPPRNTNHILKTNLNTGTSTKITIVDEKYRVTFRYCGSIIHPNGYIYFFPENNECVIKLDPKTDKWCFIGDKTSTMCFDAKIGLDGNIYGFSAYRKGIMRIDVTNDTVQMIHTDIEPGAYGTKYGADGCLYSVPGDGSKCFRYDTESDSVETVFDLKDKSKAKYAGGATLSRGNIICIPAKKKNILELSPNKEITISRQVYEFFCVDNY